MRKLKFRYFFSLFLLLFCAMCPNTRLSAASFETTQTSDLKSSTSSGFSGTQPVQNARQTGAVSPGASLADINRRYESPQSQIARGPSFPEGQLRVTTLNQPESAKLDTRVTYADIARSQSISGAETTVKAGDTSFLKKHLIRSPGSKSPKKHGDTQKYLSYDGQDIADHYKERKEEGVELIYK
ncbi:MAG: hypothetical protein KKF80_07755 [Candidatus Omnitrophica bacterium]|nr:hypothetical protein [Candidatus Omnitrophota bacterium]